MMIKWKSIDPSLRMLDAIGVKAEKNISLREAADAYLASPKVKYPDQDKYSINKVFAEFSMDRKIESILVRDLNNAYKSANKKAAGSGQIIRSMLSRLIRFAATGEVQEGPTANGSSEKNGLIGRIKYMTAKLSDVAAEIPPDTNGGDFARMKIEIQRQIRTLKEGEVGVVKPFGDEKMTDRTAKRVKKEVLKMFTQYKMPWTFVWNPVEATFFALRKSDYQKLFPTMEKNHAK